MAVWRADRRWWQLLQFSQQLADGLLILRAELSHIRVLQPLLQLLLGA